MAKIKLNKKKINYQPYHTEISLEKLKSRMANDKSFITVFKKNLTDPFIEEMKDIVNPEVKHEENFIWNVTGETGCQPKGSTVLMANGKWKKIEDIKIGDKLISFDKDMNSKVEKVIRTTKWFCAENYDVHQTNRHKKKLYSCSYNHIIPFYRRKSYRQSNTKKRRIEWVINELPAKTFDTFSKNRLSHSIMGITTPPIEKFEYNRDCEIHPYVLGMYISDGSFCHGKATNKKKAYYYLSITKMYNVSMRYINQIYPFSRISNKKGTDCKTFSWSVNSNFSKLLKKYGYNGVTAKDKFIPKQALYGKLEYRKKLLAGLIDGDGYISKGSGNYTYCSKSKKLVQQIGFLVHSVGGRVNNKYMKVGNIKKSNFTEWYCYISFHIHEDLNILILNRIRTKKSYYKSSNRQSIILKKNNKRQYVYGFTLSGTTGFYITDNFMLTHNTGKSLATISLAKTITPDNFTYKNVRFYDQQILERVKEVDRDSVLIRDETIDLFGVGSRRIAVDLQALSETARKRGVNLAFLSPSDTGMSISKFDLQTVDIDYQNRITRLAYKDPFTQKFLGAVYVQVIPEDDVDWIKYNKAKDDFIESVIQGNRVKTDYKQMAKDLFDKIDLDIYSKKSQRLALIQTQYTNLTNQEIKIIATFVEMLVDKGKYVLEDE